MTGLISKQEEIRYSRHLNIPEFGLQGQLKLRDASVLIVGCGGLGSASATYLVAAGVGHIGLVDSDVVELSNLQRQTLHGMSTMALPKVISAKKRLKDINPNVQIDIFNDRLTSENSDSIIGDYSIIVDATDNFESRYLINSICVRKKRPFIFGAIYQFSGQMSVFDSIDGPCFQCVFINEPTEEISNANKGVGVIGALPGVIGSLQAVETIKLITGVGESCIGRLMLFDGLEMKFREIRIEKNKFCPICSK